MSDAVAAVSLRGVTRRFGAVVAADAVDLDVAPGEFFAMLGPSGSGKTTCLRLIAGFEQPDDGKVMIFGEDVAGLPAYRRPVHTVFQDYALFPHMSVIDNVAYGLKVRGIGRGERLKAASDALMMVKLAEYGARRPAALSGGQRQRVALARALVLKPRVLLLDEPLGALDLKLREDMQDELKGLQRALGIAFIFVTHDQGEALGLADKVAVFDQGRVQQVGTPQQIYDTPATAFVADFVGGANVLKAPVSAFLGGPTRLTSLRPERLEARPDGEGAPAILREVTFQGAQVRLRLELGDGTQIVSTRPASEAGHFQRGTKLNLRASKDAFNLLRETP